MRRLRRRWLSDGHEHRAAQTYRTNYAKNWSLTRSTLGAFKTILPNVKEGRWLSPGAAPQGGGVYRDWELEKERPVGGKKIVAN